MALGCLTRKEKGAPVFSANRGVLLKDDNEALSASFIPLTDFLKEINSKFRLKHYQNSPTEQLGW